MDFTKAVLLCVLLAGPAFCYGNTEAGVAAVSGRPAPDFLLEGLDGRRVRIAPAGLQKTLVVYLFNAREPGWQDELAALKRLYDAHKARPDFALTAVMLANPASSNIVRTYAAERNIRFPVGRDVDNVWWTLFPAAVPRLILVGADGKIASAYFEKLSTRNYDRAALAVDELIKKRKELLALREKELREEALRKKEFPDPAQWNMEAAVRQKEAEELVKQVKPITPDELKAWLDAKKKFSLFFVGEEQAYLKRHIPGAVFKSYGVFSSSAGVDAFISGLSPGEPVVFYCGCPPDSPGASVNTAALLIKKGLNNVYSLKRHFTGWEEKGFTVEGSEMGKF